MSQPRPPRPARRLLHRLVAPQRLEALEGDLDEQFQHQLRTRGPLTAHLTFWRDVLLAAAYPRLRHHDRPSYHQASMLDMLRNYLKIALRTLKRHAGYTCINVAGLAVGLACCLLILLFVQHELSYDRFHTNADRVYRLYDDVVLPSGETNAFHVSAYVGPSIAEAYPEVDTFVRLARTRSSFVFAHEGQYYEEARLRYADSTFFDVFSFPLLRGNPETALHPPFSLVLTASSARKYFGDANPLGATLTTNDGQHTYTVTGVMADVPERSHLQFDGLISMSTAQETGTFYFEDLLDLRYATYLLLHEGASGEALEAKLPDLVERLIGDLQRREDIFNTFGLVALPEVYLHDAHHGLTKSGSRSNLYIFSAIALLTLLIAVINFMNLATARSAQRAKEVGVRKVAGAQRGQLAVQFLGESVLLSLGALVLAVGLAWLALPLFNTLAQTSLTLTALVHPGFLIVLLGSVVGVGVLAGSYPALVLSGFRPATVLKGRYLTSARGTALRKGLVIFQFAISVVLIVGTAVVYQQMRFVQGQRLGFRTEQMLVIDFRSDGQVRQQIDVIKQALRGIPNVQDVSASNVVPSRLSYTALAHVEAADGTTREMMMPVFPVDYDFITAYDLEILAGRAFSPDFPSDSTAFLLNERAVQELGYASPEDALGASLFEWGQQGQVIGVVRNFHYTSLRSEIRPINFLMVGNNARYLTLRVATDDLTHTIADVEQTWQQLVPHRPFDYQFLDDAFDAQYRAEQRFGQILGTFAGLAILVACLGLFGLAAFTVEQRRKEIGIRKVLGASVPHIVLLMSRQFTGLVIAAAVLAIPAAYVLANRWLDEFAYRTEISWWIFLLAGLTALGIAWLTVSYQSIRAALSDPVQTLRHE